MSLESENQRSLDEGSHNLDVVLKKLKISYQREFLLSLSNFDICKKLPSDFDESLLSEFEDALQSVQNRTRVPGSLPFQGFRRNEHGSSPPTRGDSGNYSRGIYGKWESHSSGQSDRESDSQSDWDSDSGRRYGLQSRRSWETSEQDGLLGSGSFPRASGHATGVSAPRGRANEPYQLRKSNEPYHPPRPYQAVPYSRRDTDAFNDETFGSLESNDDDRAEEEKRRRASFEMIRKEQQRALQEKQKLNQGKHKASEVPDLFGMLEGENEGKGPSIRNHELEVSAAACSLSNDLEKASKLLVPPGFRNNIQEKSSGMKSPPHHPLLEEGKPASKFSILDAKVNLIRNDVDHGSERRLSQENSFGLPLESIPILGKSDNVNLGISLDVPIMKKPGMEDQLLRVSSHLDSHGTLDDPEIVELNANVLEDKTAGDSKGSFPTSMLEKIFGSTLSMDDNRSSAAEHHDATSANDAWSPFSAPSSKFAQWFFEEEAKPAEDIAPAKPNDILSLIVSGDKGRSQVADSETVQHFPREFVHNILEQTNEVFDQACVNYKEEALPAVLTCEDLEQSILTEYNANTTNIQPLLDRSGRADASIEHVETPASLHLLSLLQKGTDQTNPTSNSNLDFNLTNKPSIFQAYDNGTVVSEPKREENAKNGSLTLETLFGSAFMKELKSVEAPVSVQRGSSVSHEVDVPETHGLPFSNTDNGNSLAIGNIGPQRPSYENMVLPSNQRQQIELSKSDNWVHYDNHQIGSTSPNHNLKEVPSRFEENINSVGHPRNHPMSAFLPTHNSINDARFSSNASIDIMSKLAPIRDETVTVGPENVPFRYKNLPRFQHSSQMDQMRPPFYNHLESNVAHMSPPANHQFPPNMIQRHPLHRPNVGISGFDIPRHHHSMLHQMKISGNQTPHMAPDFPGGGPVFHHGIREMEHLQGFSLGHRKPSIGNPGLPIPGPNINSGSNPLPETFQRLIEMEMRANSNHIRPLAPEHNQGIYGREVDLGFRYR